MDLTYSSTLAQPTTRGPRQIGRTDGDRVFRAAARHSRLVRFLRRAIPAMIAVVAAVLIVATFFNPFRLIAAFPIDPGKLSLSGTKVTMEVPRVHGFTTDGRAYYLTSRAAAQDLMALDLVELKDIEAHVDMRDGQRVNLNSENGLYDQKAEVLKLRDHIVLTTSSGYEGQLSEATVNVSTGHIVSESPVAVKLIDGFLKAKRLEVTGSGDLIHFGGGVELTLNRQTPASSPVSTGSVSAGATRPRQGAP